MFDWFLKRYRDAHAVQQTDTRQQVSTLHGDPSHSEGQASVKISTSLLRERRMMLAKRNCKLGIYDSW